MGVRLAHHQFYWTVPLNRMVGQDKDSSLMDLIASEEPGTFETIAQRNMKEFVENVVLGLSDRESQMIRMRFGFDDGAPKSLQAVGEVLGRLVSVYVRSKHKH